MWISIKDRDQLPACEFEVLTTDGTYCNVAERSHTNKSGEVFVQAALEGEQKEVKVTHWMPLPVLPGKADV